MLYKKFTSKISIIKQQPTSFKLHIWLYKFVNGPEAWNGGDGAFQVSEDARKTGTWKDGREKRIDEEENRHNWRSDWMSTKAQKTRTVFTQLTRKTAREPHMGKELYWRRREHVSGV